VVKQIGVIFGILIFFDILVTAEEALLWEMGSGSSHGNRSLPPAFGVFNL